MAAWWLRSASTPADRRSMPFDGALEEHLGGVRRGERPARNQLREVRSPVEDNVIAAADDPLERAPPLRGAPVVPAPQTLRWRDGCALAPRDADIPPGRLPRAQPGQPQEERRSD